jgi:hypothetical protein
VRQVISGRKEDGVTDCKRNCLKRIPTFYISTSFLSSFRKPKMERRGEREKLLFTRKKRKNTRSVCLGMACNKKKEEGGAGGEKTIECCLAFYFLKEEVEKILPCV